MYHENESAQTKKVKKQDPICVKKNKKESTLSQKKSKMNLSHVKSDHVSDGNGTMDPDVAINDEWWSEHESEIGTFPSRRCSFQHSAEMVDRIYQELE